MGGLCFIGLPLSFQLLVEDDGLRSGFPGGAIFFVFIGGVPVHQSVGDFFPLIAFRAKVTDPIRFLFPFGSELVRTIFQDEALCKLLGLSGKGYQQEYGESR